VQSEAKRLRMKLDIAKANGDNARQALHLQEAVAPNPDAIFVRLGLGDTLSLGLEATGSAGVPIPRMCGRRSLPLCIPHKY
jgi:simple sugar transport system substrate-binding protein